jgi:hypothetical protein
MKKYPSKKELEELFFYQEGNLFWKNPPLHYSRLKGKKAGSISRNYYIVGVKGTDFSVHRLVWIFFNSEIKNDSQIDHIDHNSLNNKIENLRLVSNKENSQNQKFRINNKSGFNGVCWVKWANRWKSCIQVEGKTKFLGYFKNLDCAIASRKIANIRYNYHKNHGKEST